MLSIFCTQFLDLKTNGVGIFGIMGSLGNRANGFHNSFCSLAALPPCIFLPYTVNMNLFYQSLLVFAGTLVLLGYFKFRHNPDIIDIVQEMARPMYLVTAVIIAIAYIVIRLVLGGLIGAGIL